MKKLISALLAVAMMLSAPLYAYAQERESPIVWLQTFTLNTTDGKELLSAGDSVDFAVEATDNVQIADVRMLLESPSKKNNIIIKMENDGVSDVYTAHTDITEETEAGYWGMTAIQATDTSGNYMYISALTDYTYGVKGVINEADISFRNGSTYTYSKRAIKPEMLVTNKGKVLTQNVDYKLTYANNINVGTASVTITGIGCFDGEFTKQFTIKPQTKFTAKLSTTSYTYNGKVKRPSVTVYDGKDVVPTSSYTLTYAKGRKNVGKYAVKITMKGNYSGTKTLYFTVKPKGTSISKTAAKKKAAVIKWKKQTKQVTGYQIRYSTSPKFTKSRTKTVTVKSNKTTKKTVKKLKAKRGYYFQIRTYKTTSNKKYYSKWSKTKYIKTK